MWFERTRVVVMDSTIIAGIIGGVCTLGGALLTFILTRRSPDHGKPYISHRNRQLVKGQWEGKVSADAIPNIPPIEYRISARITASSRVIRAEATLHSQFKGREITDVIDIFGTLAYDRFLKLEYRAKDRPEVIQFGYLILELSPNGRVLEGRFLSYSPHLQCIVYGYGELHKVSS
jgi:hypothetical protein